MTTDRELRDALQAHADGPAGPPPGWDEVRQRGRHRVRVQRARSLALAGLVAVAGFGVVSMTRQSPNAVFATTGAPTTTTTTAPAVDADRLIIDARTSGTTLTLLLHVGPKSIWVSYGYPLDMCQELIGFTVDRDTYVDMHIVGREGRPGSWNSCQSDGDLAWVTTEMDPPLAGRPLIEVGTDREIRVLDSSRLLFPTQLPAPFEVGRRSESSSGPSSGPIGRWEFTWTGGGLSLSLEWDSIRYGDPPRRCEDGTNRVTEFGDGDDRLVTVRGLPGLLSGGDSKLIWRDGESCFYMSVSRTDGGSFDSPDDLNRDIDLVAIANSLEPLG